VGALILDILPYALAAALAAPIVAVVTAVILAESKRPLLSACAFTAGAATLDLVFAVALLAIANASGAFGSGDSEAGAIVDIVLGSIFLLLGVVAVFSKDDPEKQAAQRERIRRAASGGLRTMVITGIAAQAINIDALAVFTGAIKEISEAGVSTGQAAVALLVGLAVMLVPYYGPALVYAVAPERSGPRLRGMSEWMLDRSRLLEIVVGLGFGAIFLAKGIAEITA
jgi:small-conductance mechanosensitive channel